MARRRDMIPRSVLLLFVLLLFCRFPLFAQNQYDISQFRDETTDFFKQPGEWRGSDWLKLGAVVTGTALVMQVDQPVRHVVLQNQERYNHSVPIEAGRIWGEWYTSAAIAAAFGLHGWQKDHTPSKKTGFELVQAVLYSEAITQTLKITLGRARPYENKGAFSFRPLALFHLADYSLPSGHSTNGWAVSTVLSKNASSDAVKALLYVPAVLTLISRVYQDQHWTSDVLLGAVIGYVVGGWVVETHTRKASSEDAPTVYIFSVRVNF